MNNHIKALIVDDEAELRTNVQTILATTISGIEFQFEEASNGFEALDKIRNNPFDLVLMDVKMPELTGLEALPLIKDHDPQIMVVIMTAHSNLTDAKAAIRDGAYDYVEKPVQKDTLVDIIQKSLEARKMVKNLSITSPIFDDDLDTEIVGQTLKMKEVFNLIYKLSKVETTVLVRGENGTGKELVAQAIHFNSPRKSGQFIAINCGAIPEALIESELFGHEKGSFTGAIDRKIGKFQLANNGTLFLDEIGELKPELQVKLLRVLQEKKFTPIGSSREVKTNARIIAATNRNLEKMMQESKFREDLFYRLNVMPIFLPPLRERTEDIPYLAQRFIQKFNLEQSRNILGIEESALTALKKHKWPGNIRELENLIERAFILETSTMITLQSLPAEFLSPHPSDRGTVSKSENENLNYDDFKEEMEKEFVINALKQNKGKINQTVAVANIPKNTLLRKIKKYEINVDDYKDE